MGCRCPVAVPSGGTKNVAMLAGEGPCAPSHRSCLLLLQQYLCKQSWESLPQHGLLLKILF